VPFILLPAHALPFGEYHSKLPGKVYALIIVSSVAEFQRSLFFLHERTGEGVFAGFAYRSSRAASSWRRGGPHHAQALSHPTALVPFWGERELRVLPLICKSAAAPLPMRIQSGVLIISSHVLLRTLFSRLVGTVEVVGCGILLRT
jgi:hypothetical protein